MSEHDDVVDPDGEAHDYDAHCDTEFGPQIQAQAWSEGEQPPEPVNHRTHHLWWWVGGLIAVILVLAGVVTNAVIATASQKDDHNRWPTGYTNPPPPTPASPVPDPPGPPPGPFVPNMNVAAHLTPDGDFLQRVLAAGWDYDNKPGAIQDAHDWCTAMRVYGVSPTWVAGALYDRYGGLPNYPDYPKTVKIVNAAVAVYCPGLG